MIPLSALGGGGGRPPGGGPPPLGGSGGGGPSAGLRPGGGGGPPGGMIPLGALGGSGGPAQGPPGGPPGLSPPSMAPPTGLPPMMAPPGSAPPGGMQSLGQSGGLGGAAAAPPMGMPQGPPATPPAGQPDGGSKGGEPVDTLAEVGKAAKDYLDVLMPISIPAATEDSRPVPRQVQCLEDGTDLFKMFDLDMNRFDPKAVRKAYHKMALFVHPEKIGREATAPDKARFTKLKQAYTVVMDDQLRAVYRQHCYGIAGSGGVAAQGHDVALAKALEMGRDLRKMGEERAIVLHKAAETGWAVQQKDQDGRTMRGDGRKVAHKFNLFGEISDSEDDEAELEKERRGMSPAQIIEKSPKYADAFLDKVKPLLTEPRVSKLAAGGAFTMHEEMRLLELLNDNPKTVQKHLRKVRSSLKQMNWAMTSLLQHKSSPWRGLEAKSSLAEHSVVKLLEIIKSGIAFGKFSEVHEEDFTKVIDHLHRLYMDIFEKRGQELLRGAIGAELAVVYLLPESGGRLPDGTRVMLQDLKSRPDLNGKSGTISNWDYSLQRYTVELEKEETKREAAPQLPSNPDLLALDDVMDDDDQEEETKAELNLPKKIMVMVKNALVDLEPPRKKLEALVKDWNAWRRRPRSVSASQDAEAVAAALGPPLESMASYLQEAASAVGTGSACGRDGADLIAFECREALQGARNLAAKLLGETPEEPPPPPPLNEPPPALVPVKGSGDEVSQALKEAAEVASMGIEIKADAKKRSRSRGRKKRSRSKSRSRSKKKRRKHSSSESRSCRPQRKPKYG
mmetsp:Transcript_86104/g.251927  ORF Transcript_86104/g.251927 Transcript_86104/m.251927 type:complete len:790 (-) Transcript_86104:39-2408(-)